MGLPGDWIEGKPTNPEDFRNPSGEEAEFPPAWAAFFESASRYEQFESLVRKYFKRQGRSAMITDGVLTLGSSGAAPDEQPEQMGLGNIAQTCAAAETALWDELIERHFEGLRRGREDEKAIRGLVGDWDWARQHLVVRLWEEQDIFEKAALWVTRHDIPGLVTVLSLDLPRTVRTVLRKDTRTWSNQSEDEWFATAIENIVRMSPVEQGAVEHEENEVQVAEGESVYVASRLLRLGDFPSFIGVNGAFVSVPVRNVVFGVAFDGPDSLKAVATLMELTLDAEARGPGSVSRRVWWWRDGEFEEVEYEVNDEGLHVYPGERLQGQMESLE